uniref:helix-turn-helix transcriptional regulator n=1 Tax=Mucilaginibacter sp. Bleaf8 TaxID=2834430 RepID=UPI0020BF0BF2|nr:helix-turn-helix transcriptional regulator [Mucilaginibacter sp. Bleaf8]
MQKRIFLSYLYWHKIAVIATQMAEKRNYNRIKAVLAERGKTNIWLAEQLQRNKTTVSKWCTNDIQPTVESLFEIAKVLEVDVRQLLVSSLDGK